MIYHQGQRVRHFHGKLDTISQDSEDHGIVRVLWDGATEVIQELPECVRSVESKPAQASVNAWDAYQSGRKYR